MEVFGTKILCAALSVTLSLVFGFLPLSLRGGRCAINIDPASPDYKKSRRGNQILAFLLNFGGGVLIANCFCHWLPEVREGIEHRDIDTVLPLAEVIMCCGFFSICFLEEILHVFLQPHAEGSEKKKKTKKGNSGKVGPASAGDDDDKKWKNHNGEEGAPEEGETLMKSKDSDFDRTLSAIRTFFVVFALSFHSVIEGLALSLEEDASGVWLNFGALAMHKFVIAFAVGIELIAVQASRLNYAVSIVVFSLAPALGVTVGMVITREGGGGEGSIDDFAIQVLQGIATGTILYVVFFEIFPKARQIGGAGFRSVLAMTLGFGAFLPSLLFHSHEDEDHHGCAEISSGGHSAEVFNTTAVPL